MAFALIELSKKKQTKEKQKRNAIEIFPPKRLTNQHEETSSRSHASHLSLSSSSVEHVTHRLAESLEIPKQEPAPSVNGTENCVVAAAAAEESPAAAAAAPASATEINSAETLSVQQLTSSSVHCKEIEQENIKHALHEIISEIDREMEADFNEDEAVNSQPSVEVRKRNPPNAQIPKCCVFICQNCLFAVWNNVLLAKCFSVLCLHVRPVNFLANEKLHSQPHENITAPLLSHSEHICPFH